MGLQGYAAGLAAVPYAVFIQLAISYLFLSLMPETIEKRVSHKIS